MYLRDKRIIADGLANIHGSLLQATIKLLKEKKIEPINPLKIFQSSEIEDAFRYMQKGLHIGKVLIRMPNSFEKVPTKVASSNIRFSAEKTYLLVGGLGGLGRAISTWMAERGARQFTYLSRSAGSSKNLSFIQELESQGCTVKVIVGSVSHLKDVEKAIKASQSPISGVLQMSMVLRDTLFSEHRFEDWCTVVDPKIKGTWNLHHALQNHKLDFFLLFSSFSGIVGLRGQAAYAAANTFLDSFVSYRHLNGLPASVLDIGVMTDIGYLVGNESLQESLIAQDNHILKEADLIDALQLSISSNMPAENSVVDGIKNPSHLVLGMRSRRPLSDQACRAVWRHDRRMGIYHNTSSSSASISPGSGNDGLKIFLERTRADPSALDDASSIDFLSELIGTQIYTFMMHPIEELDVSQSLAGLGVDSLVTIEIRNWWRRSLGFEASTLEILSAGTIIGLARLAVEGLKKKVGRGS